MFAKFYVLNTPALIKIMTPQTNVTKPMGNWKQKTSLSWCNKNFRNPAWISLYWTQSWDECEMAPTLRSNEHSLTLLCKGQADISQMGNAGKSISARGNGMHEARRASSWNRSQPRRFGKTRQFMSRIFLQTKPSQEVSGRIKTEHLYAMCKFNILTIQPCFLMVLNL